MLNDQGILEEKSTKQKLVLHALDLMRESGQSKGVRAKLNSKLMASGLSNLEIQTIRSWLSDSLECLANPSKEVLEILNLQNAPIDLITNSVNDLRVEIITLVLGLNCEELTKLKEFFIKDVRPTSEVNTSGVGLLIKPTN